MRVLLWCLPNKFYAPSLRWQTPQRPICRQLTQKHLDRLWAVGLQEALYNKANWATVSWTVIVHSVRFSQGSYSFLGPQWALLEDVLTLSGHWGAIWCTEAIIYGMIPWRPQRVKATSKRTSFFPPSWNLHGGILLNIFKNFYLLTLSKLHHHALWLSPHMEERERKWCCALQWKIRNDESSWGDGRKSSLLNDREPSWFPSMTAILLLLHYCRVWWFGL